MNILLYNNKTVFWLQSIEPDTTQAFKHSCLKKTCPTTVIHWSQIKPTYFQNWLYKKRSLFFLATQKFLVTNYQHVVGKEVNLVYTEMKEAGTHQPTQCTSALSLQKQSFAPE
jgi:hypothetical protein